MNVQLSEKLNQSCPLNAGNEILKQSCFSSHRYLNLISVIEDIGGYIQENPSAVIEGLECIQKIEKRIENLSAALDKKRNEYAEFSLISCLENDDNEGVLLILYSDDENEINQIHLPSNKTALHIALIWKKFFAASLILKSPLVDLSICDKKGDDARALIQKLIDKHSKNGEYSFVEKLEEIKAMISGRIDS